LLLLLLLLHKLWNTVQATEEAHLLVSERMTLPIPAEAPAHPSHCPQASSSAEQEVHANTHPVGPALSWTKYAYEQNGHDHYWWHCSADDSFFSESGPGQFVLIFVVVVVADVVAAAAHV
jgi:hypothetical protein